MVERKESLKAGRTVGSLALSTVVPLASTRAEELELGRVGKLVVDLAACLVVLKVARKVAKKDVPTAIWWAAELVVSMAGKMVYELDEL